MSPPARALTLALLAAATWAAFAGALRNGSILLDDPLYVFANPIVRGGLTLEGARHFLVEPHSGNWHPLTSWSHMLDVQLFGLEPAGHHATSVVLHVINALLLLLVLHRLTGAWWRSALVAGFFALHPLRVESVAWISERKDVLSGLFFLLTIEAYRRWVERPGPALYALVIASFALGLMSKPMLVTLPCVLVLLDVWPLSRLAAGARATPVAAPATAPSPSRVPPTGRAPARALGGLIVEKWPLFAMSIVASLITFIVQRKAGAVVSTVSAPFDLRVSNALISYWRYVAKIVWPTGLAPFYPYEPGFHLAAALAAAAGLLAVTALTLWQVRRRPYLAVGWLWYVGMLLPVIGLIQVGSQGYADRYTYLPVIGLGVAVVWGVGELVARRGPARLAAAAACGLVLVALGVATARQVALWKDSRTLFAHTLAVTRDNAVAHQNMGNVFMIAGDPRAAIPHFQEALRLQPEFPNLRGVLGSALGMVGRYDEAAAQFQAALGHQETADLHFDLGLVYAKQGRVDDAIRECEAALRLDPHHYRAHAQLGAGLVTAGRPDEALAHLRRATELEPGEIATWRLLATTCAATGRFPEAVQAIERAIALAGAANARDEEARLTRLRDLYKAGRTERAAP